MLSYAVNHGNVDFVDWLVETFDLDVHQWAKVMLN